MAGRMSSNVAMWRNAPLEGVELDCPAVGFVRILPLTNDVQCLPVAASWRTSPSIAVASGRDEVQAPTMVGTELIQAQTAERPRHLRKECSALPPEKGAFAWTPDRDRISLQPAIETT